MAKLSILGPRALKKTSIDQLREWMIMRDVTYIDDELCPHFIFFVRDQSRES